MSKNCEAENAVEEIYLSSIRKAQENIEISKHHLKGDKSKKISFKDCEFAIKNHTNEMTKLVKEASLIRGATSNSIKDYYDWLVKCDGLIRNLSYDDINKKIHEMFNAVIVEINSRCKPVLL
ncbi:hypothetical protein, conserved [Plasmodium gonderi]|uniref:Uncharacterized protein n=1 Tax=Plasmodium gonderi TaxID=77519 RepID=A0A1Y1JJS0_PLAGO|nr:hypothetical protein, conserved [Plasmodium gonderi]GAW81898.1 hypothetical protein, conserved [Plasmodium gonderi]